MMFCEADPEPLRRLVQQHRQRLFSMARRYGLSPEDALDCAQDAFVTFLQSPAQPAILERPEEAARLLTAITKNTIRSTRRLVKKHERRIEDSAETSQDAEQTLAQKEALCSLRRCLLSLKENQRALVMLRFFEEVPGQDVAAQLGLTPQNVAVLLHRAKESLRGCMVARQG